MTEHMRTSLRRKAAVAIFAVATAFCGGQANASVIQLGFILDSSGSIGSGNWSTIINGLGNAVNTLVPTDGSYEVSVVSFSSGASIIVDHVLIDSVATRSSVASTISSTTTNPFLNGGTAMDTGFSTMQAALTSSSLFDANGASYVNLATDGIPNSTTAATAARDALIAAGIDNISIEAIGTGVDATYLQNSLCYPQACDTTSPYNFPSQGFYIPVSDAAGYVGAINTKIRTVVGNVPEPNVVLIFGLGLLSLVLVRRLATH